MRLFFIPGAKQCSISISKTIVILLCGINFYGFSQTSTLVGAGTYNGGDLFSVDNNGSNIESLISFKRINGR